MNASNPPYAKMPERPQSPRMTFSEAAKDLALIAASICCEVDASTELISVDENLLAATIGAGVAQVALCLRQLQLMALDGELAAALAKT